MFVKTKKRILVTVCYLMAISLGFGPALQASTHVASQSADQNHEFGNCQDIADAEKYLADPANYIDGHAGALDCNHGLVCNALCGISISILQQQFTASAIDENSDRWAPINPQTLQYPYLSLLKKPPRL